MATKFVRGLEWNLGTSHATHMEGCFLFKLIYEFWCYCVNGGSDPQVPGGLASPTPSTLVTNFTAGTSLIHYGTNGSTSLGGTIFTASGGNFSANDIGRYLVMWKPNSGSSEDSIYRIDGYVSPTQIIINVNNGGTPSVADLRPSLTARSSICYRVFDHKIAGAAGTINTYAVFQMDGYKGTGIDGYINAGQTNPQAQFWIVGASNYETGNSPVSIGITLSPNATWNGSAFTDSSTQLLCDNTTSGLFSGAKAINTDGNNTTTIIGDKDFLLTHTGGESCTGGTGALIHLEIPERVHATDINPLACMLIGGNFTNGAFYCADISYGYGGGFKIRWDDYVFRKCRTISKSIFGDYFTVGPALTSLALATSYDNAYQYYSFRPYLSQVGIVGHYTAFRVRLRKVMLVGSSTLQQGMKFGNNGEWYHVNYGVLWPWDNTNTPYNIFWRGYV